MAMPSWTAMLNSQLFLLSGAANLAAGKLFGIENLAKIGVEKVDQLIMPSWTTCWTANSSLCLARQISLPVSLIKVENLAEKGVKIDQMIMHCWTGMLNSQLFLLSGAANLAASKLVTVENLAE